jgi:hypothetical protein
MATRFHDCFAFVERIPGGTAEVVLVRSNTETSQLLRLNNFESDPGFGSVTIELECLSVYQLLKPRPNKPAQGPFEEREHWPMADRLPLKRVTSSNAAW